MRDPLIIAGATGYGVWPATSLCGAGPQRRTFVEIKTDPADYRGSADPRAPLLDAGAGPAPSGRTAGGSDRRTSRRSRRIGSPGLMTRAWRSASGASQAPARQPQ
ncbi:hypothetical protein [Phenylobacterium sp.]|jgi:hypothetical protein|uniref:hypothetical protein n=1 Tax=Phenylobacterium sp. TaxID=1871053 RepID=UPI0037C59685